MLQYTERGADDALPSGREWKGTFKLFRYNCRDGVHDAKFPLANEDTDWDLILEFTTKYSQRDKTV